MVINTCQTWSKRAKMQLNADKSKVMYFLETLGLAMHGNDHGRFRVSVMYMFVNTRDSVYSSLLFIPTAPIRESGQ